MVDAPLMTGVVTVTGTLTLPTVEHAPLVTVTLSVTLPLAGAVKLTDGVAPPPVIAPLVIVQLYVAPAVAVTLARLFVLFAQTFAGAVMVAGAGLETVIVVAAEVAEQLP